MEKVIRFYVPNGNESIYRIMNMDLYLEENVSFELCTIRYGMDENDNKLVTIPFTRSSSGKAVMQDAIDGWKELDPNKQYYLELEFCWLNSGGVAPQNVELSDGVPHTNMPKQAVKLFRNKNVASIGLWDAWTDGERLREAVKCLKHHGFPAHDHGKFISDGIIYRYAELQEDYEEIKEGPRIGFEPIPTKEVQQADGNLTVMDGEKLSVIRKINGVKTLPASKEENKKMLVPNNGGTFSKEE